MKSFRPFHAQGRLTLGAVILAVAGCTEPEPSQSVSDATLPSVEQQAVTIERGVVDNDVPAEFSLVTLKQDAAPDVGVYNGLWSGDFTVSRTSGPLGPSSPIEINISGEYPDWRITGSVPNQETATASNIRHEDKVLSFEMNSGTFNGDGVPLPYFIDVVSREGELQGLLRWRIVPNGDQSVDKYHILRMSPQPTNAAAP